MKKRRIRELGRTEKFALATVLSLASFFAISFISALCSGFFENSHLGAEYLTLATLLCSGVVSGFICEKILHSPIRAMLAVGAIAIAFVLLSSVISGYSLGAFMNHITFLLLSPLGMLLAKEKKHKRHRR